MNPIDANADLVGDAVDLVTIDNPDGTPLELSEMQALELKSLLEASGIEAIVSGAEMLPNLPYRLLVPASEQEQAEQAISDATAAGTAGADEAELAGEAAGDATPE